MQCSRLKTTVQNSLVMAALGLPLSLIAAAAAPTTQLSSAATTQPAENGSRTPDQIGKDLIQLSKQIQSTGGSPAILADAAKRSEIATTLIPLVKRERALIDEYASAVKNSGPIVPQMKQHNTAMLYLLGDVDTVARTNTAAQGNISDAAVEAFSTRLLSQWIAAGSDLDAQIKVVDQIEALDETHPENIQLTNFTFQLSRGTASNDLADRLMSIGTEKMHNPAASFLKKQIPAIHDYRAAGAAAMKQLKSLENKPLTVTGKTPQGRNFTTADLKGKVILVDFWAAWCGPCKEELPRVKAIYANFHDKGLEILGVSNDFSKTDLIDFTSQNEMPWPELFDASAASGRNWNPITLGYGIRGIPTLFLIDKKGILRTVNARETMEGLIPKLIAE